MLTHTCSSKEALIQLDIPSVSLKAARSLAPVGIGRHRCPILQDPGANGVEFPQADREPGMLQKNEN